MSNQKANNINDIGRKIISDTHCKSAGVVAFINHEGLFIPFNVPVIGETYPSGNSAYKKHEPARITVDMGNDPSRIMGKWTISDDDFK